MSHTITVGGLLLVLAIIVGLAFSAVGALMIFAGGMSDAPAAGDSASRQGCFVSAIGVVLLVGGAWGLLS